MHLLESIPLQLKANSMLFIKKLNIFEIIDLEEERLLGDFVWTKVIQVGSGEALKMFSA